MLKTLISIGLSILVFTRGLHVELHKHTPINGYSICETSCDDENHYNSFHQCEKCLTKNSKLANPNCGYLTYDRYLISYYGLNESIKNIFTHYSLYSRPPPNLI